MSDSIDLLEPKGFIPNDLRPPNIIFRLERAKRIIKKAVAVYQNANGRVATESTDNISAGKSMRLSNEFNPSHRLSTRLVDAKRPSPVPSRLDDGLPTDKQPLANLKERLEIQNERETNVDTDNPQFIKFLKYGMRRDHNEWSLPRSLGDIKIISKNLNCSFSIPANFSSNLVVNLSKDLNQWRLKDGLPDERKYVIDNHNLNALNKAPFGVATAFSEDPSPFFSLRAAHRNS